MRGQTAARLLAVAFLVAAAGLFAQAPTEASSAGAAQTQAAAQTAAVSAPAAPSTLTLTIDQAIDRAMSNQPLIQQALAAVEAARARVGQAESAYYPNLSASGSYNRISDESFTIASVLPPGLDPASLGLPPALAPLLTSPLALAPVDNWDFHLGLNQVIYQFGKRGVQVSLARNGVSAALIGVDQIKMSLAYQAAAGFYTVLFMRRELAALDEQAQNLQEHLKATRVKADTGAATRYDELATEVRVTGLHSQRIEAQTQYDKQVIGLKQLLGLNEADQLTLSGDFVPPAGPGNDPQSLIADALAKRPDVRQAAEAESAAELSTRLAGLAAWPTLSAHASVGYKNGLLPDITALNFNWVAGVQLNVPIFQGFLVARQSDEAQKRLEAARQSSMAVRRTATVQVLQAVRDVQAAREQLATSEQQEEEARQMLEMVKLQYDLGMLTNLEYLDAQAAMERAQVGSLQARYKAVLSEYGLMQATGSVIWASSQAKAQGG